MNDYNKTKIDSLINKARLPKRHLALRKRHGNTWLTLRKQLQSKSGYLMAFIGNRGTGKTQMAVDLCVDCCSKLLPCRYQKTIEFFMDVRKSYGDNRVDESSVIDKYIEPYLLVLDEAHVRGCSPWEDRMLTHLMDKRYDAGQSTILISNQSKNEFIRAVGDSISSRLDETGKVIEFKGRGYRGKGEGV